MFSERGLRYGKASEDKPADVTSWCLEAFVSAIAFAVDLPAKSNGIPQQVILFIWHNFMRCKNADRHCVRAVVRMN
jgi:hypothetical protein